MFPARLAPKCPSSGDISGQTDFVISEHPQSVMKNPQIFPLRVNRQIRTTNKLLNGRGFPPELVQEFGDSRFVNTVCATKDNEVRKRIKPKGLEFLRPARIAKGIRRSRLENGRTVGTPRPRLDNATFTLSSPSADNSSEAKQIRHR